MTTVFFLLKRYLLPKEGSLLSLALWISVAGVAIGVMQLILVLSVMSGFMDLFQRNYTRISSEMVVIPRSRKEAQDQFRKELLSVPGVAEASPFGLGQAMIIHQGVSGSTLEGIDYETSKRVTPWEQVWKAPPLWEIQEKEPRWIWLGSQLADKLGAKPGDTVSVMIPSKRAKRIIPFKVTAITKFGIHEHDSRSARISLTLLKEIFRTHHIEPMYKIKLADGADLDLVASSLRAKFGDDVDVRKWHQVHQNIFLAVQHQKLMLFAILEIIVALAAMNVINLLMMSAHQKRKDVAILRALGMRFRQLIFFFVGQGAAVGAVGVGLGIGLGVLVCKAVQYWQPSLLREEIYNVTELPVVVHTQDILLVAVVGLIVCVLFSFIPAIGAAMSPPVKVLRDE